MPDADPGPAPPWSCRLTEEMSLCIRATLRAFSYGSRFSTSTLHSSNWELLRYTWKETGNCTDVNVDLASDAVTVATRVSRQQARYNRVRREEMERRRHIRPARIRHQNILQALRESSKTVELSRPMPLAAMIQICNRLWAEEAAAANSNMPPHWSSTPQ